MLDNCPAQVNDDQRDIDGDLLGDVCDLDRDGDGFDDAVETACDSDPEDPAGVPADADLDAVCDALDNCVDAANPHQADADDDGRGNACDVDTDGDGAPDAYEIECGSDPANRDESPLDPDGDGVCDLLDNCPLVANPPQRGAADGRELACQTDPLDALNPDQADLDGDGRGDACDVDQDGDGVDDGPEVDCGSNPRDPESVPGDDDDDGACDALDNCPLPNADQADADGDGLGDACDADDDGDGVDDALDNCPSVANADQADLDDGFGCDGDNCAAMRCRRLAGLGDAPGYLNCTTQTRCRSRWPRWPTTTTTAMGSRRTSTTARGWRTTRPTSMATGTATPATTTRTGTRSTQRRIATIWRRG